MTSSIKPEVIPLRKKELRHQISQALEIGANEKINCLRAQWVHRFGIETLKEFEQQELDFSYCKSSNEFPLSPGMGFSDCRNREEDDILNSLKNKPSVDYLPKSLDEELMDVNDEILMQSEKLSLVLSDEKSEENPKEVPSVRISPPPKPFLNHLRRWLPSIDDSLPKAS